MVQLEGVGKTVAGKHLFRGVTWTLHPGERIGLVGANGVGKTSLLRIIAGQDEPDEGKLHRRSGIQVAYLPQEVEAETAGSATVLETVLAGAEHLRQIGRELTALEEQIERASRSDDQAQAARLSEIYGEKRALFEWAGGDQVETRSRVVLGGLGFARDEIDAPLSVFSGGWRMRALMGRMLLSGSDILLLDEPTNHLDLDALSWLENHLASSPAAVIVVSHDRVFLDRVALRIAELSRERVRVYKGGYTAWRQQRDAEREQAARRDAKLEATEARLETFVERFRYKATKAAQAQERLKMLDEVREERAGISQERDHGWRVSFPPPPPSGDPLVQLTAVEKRFGEKVVLTGVNLTLRRGERIAVMGPNGAGKTTLLRLIAGEIFPERGKRELGHALTTGRYAQHQLEALDPDATVLNEALKTAPGKKPEEVRRALGSLGIGDLQIERRVRTLSGGERARVALARLLLNPAALLMLDEPTNHLDLPLREALEQGLADWPGSLLVVSHDRAFLQRVTATILALESGTVTRIDGGWEAWLEWRAQQRTLAPAGPLNDRSRESRRQRATALQDRSRRLRPLKDEFATVEAAIHADEARQRQIDDELADPAVHAQGERVRALVKEREQLVRGLPSRYGRWEELAERIATIEAET